MTIIKKIFGSLFLLLSMPIFAFSSANVNQTWFYPGEAIVLTVTFLLLVNNKSFTLGIESST
jgi:hypothetical protein